MIRKALSKNITKLSPRFLSVSSCDRKLLQQQNRKGKVN
jgi:hypothetical protein